MNDKYIFKSINTKKEKKSFKEFLRHQTNSEYGGYKIYDGSRNHLLQIPEELSELVFFLNKFQKKKSNFKSFLEIGFASGKTNTIFNRFFKFNQIVAVDNFACDINANDLFANVQRKKLILLCGSSSSKEIKNNLKKFSPFDLILIDGSHEYKDVINDINISTNLINNKGIIVMHDIYNKEYPGVGKAWSTLKKNKKFSFKEIVCKKYYFNCGFGIAIKRK